MYDDLERNWDNHKIHWSRQMEKWCVFKYLHKNHNRSGFLVNIIFLIQMGMDLKTPEGLVLKFYTKLGFLKLSINSLDQISLYCGRLWYAF